MVKEIDFKNDQYDKKMREMFASLDEFQTLISVLEIVGYIGTKACMMRSQGLSLQQIANKLNRKKPTVQYWCKKCDEMSTKLAIV